MAEGKNQYVPGDESFAAYLRIVAGSTIELELVSGRSVTGHLSGVHNDWVMIIDAEKKQTIAQLTHVAAVRVLAPKSA
jgi:hypothetical protein